MAADDEQLADLVGAVSAIAILGVHAKKSLQVCYLLDHRNWGRNLFRLTKSGGGRREASGDSLAFLL